jgi:hypothetical protein
MVTGYYFTDMLNKNQKMLYSQTSNCSNSATKKCLVCRNLKEEGFILRILKII